jgi:hypothetical protein
MTIPTTSGPARVSLGRGSQLAFIGQGDASSFHTAMECRRLAIESQLDPAVVDVARSLAATVPARDYSGCVYAIRNFLAQRFHFVRDVRDAEMIEPVADQIERIRTQGRTYGDCDDAATLAAGLLLCVGHETRFVLVAFEHPRAPFEHIYTEGLGNGCWIDIDITKPAGVVPAIGRERIIDL